MKATDIFTLMGGLALFLYGMQMMSSGLEAAAGNRMKQILERLTSNRFLGLLVGAGITAAIQSSSGTTVMVVGFVNSGMMTLQQAVWIIMGANVGTTITGQLIALDIGALAPLIVFVGVVLVVFIKKPSVHHYGQIIAGLGILFLGMEMMSGAMMPLRELPAFVNMMTSFSNPLVGIFVGMLFTAVIQSSSASVGILQALAVSGLIGLDSAVFVLFGQNIGTCITAVLASIGTSRAARRATIIHLLFNIIGTAIFTLIFANLPLTQLVASITPGNPSAQIANMHTLFNVATTLMLLPFGTQLAKLATRLLPELPSEKDEEQHLKYLKPLAMNQEYHIGTSAIAINGLWQELGRMAKMVNTNVGESFDAVLDQSTKRRSSLEKTEDYIDYLNKELSRYLSRLITVETNEKDSALITAFFKITSNLERIGDHAFNICGYTTRMEQEHIRFSAEARQEISQMQEISLQAMSLLLPLEQAAGQNYQEIVKIEQTIDDMTLAFRHNQMARIQADRCGEAACVLYSEMLTDFERIGDHILNIGQELASAVPAPHRA